ncbi:hypothetical protein ACLOJK_010893, partial [Asimina triloba]
MKRSVRQSKVYSCPSWGCFVTSTVGRVIYSREDLSLVHDRIKKNRSFHFFTESDRFSTILLLICPESILSGGYELAKISLNSLGMTYFHRIPSRSCRAMLLLSSNIGFVGVLSFVVVFPLTLVAAFDGKDEDAMKAKK